MPAGSGKIALAHPEKLKELKNELKEVYEESIYIAAIQASGTPRTWMWASSAAISPSKTGR